MRQLLQACLLVVAVLVLGCERAAPSPATPSKGVARGHRWGEPYDWLNNPPAVRAVDFSAIKIDDPALRDTVVRWESAASRLHAEGWFHHGWYADPGKLQFGALQWWSLNPEYVDPRGSIESGAHSKPGSLHHIRIACGSNLSVLQPEFVVLTAEWMPERTGWGIRLDVTSRGRDEGHVMLSFYPRGIDDAPSRYNFYPGLGRWEHHVKFEEVNYAFQVALPSAEFDGGGMSASLDFDRLRDWSSSADSFRSAGLEMLNRLEQAMRQQIPTGAATKQVSVNVFPMEEVAASQDVAQQRMPGTPSP